MVKNKKAFTLVELLAVIVILAVILVIAVPQIMNVITESRKGALASSAKLIASSAESAYISNQTLGIEKDIECSDVSSYKEEDYTCSLEFVDGKAQVTLEGKGKFEGMAVCAGTKEEAEVEKPKGGKCPTPFEKDDWATIKAAVTSGNTSKYNVGDTRTIDLGSLGTHTVRIANTTPCDGTLASQTACGFVIEFADIIKRKEMNTTNTNEGGWPASEMRTYLNSKDKDGNHVDGGLYDLLVAAIGDIIIDTKVVSSHGSVDASNFTTLNVKLYLLSPEEVYGTSPSFDTSRGTSRQLEYYENNNVTESKYAGAIKQYSGSNESWWLRSAYSSNSGNFYDVSYNGAYCNDFAYYASGVSPAFRLG